MKNLLFAGQFPASPPFVPPSCPRRNFPRLSVCPDLCPSRAHSSAFQRRNACESRGAHMAEPARRSQELLAETWGVGRDLHADLRSRLLLLPQASRGDPTAPPWH